MNALDPARDLAADAEDVSLYVRGGYDGPVGTFRDLHMADVYDGPPPAVYSVRIVVPMISAPELDDEQARAYLHARMVTYLGQPGLAEAYARINGWDPKLAAPVREHPMFAHDPDRVDHNFHRDQLMEVAKLVPDEWMYSTSLAGSVADCVAKMAEYRAAGADEICFYGSTAAENAALVAAWRGRLHAAAEGRT